MGVSLSLPLSVSFYVLEGPAKTLAEVFGNAAGLGSQPLRLRRSITQTDRGVSIGLRTWWSLSLSLSPSVLKVRVAGWWSLSMSHSHSAGEGRLRKLIMRFLSAYADGGLSLSLCLLLSLR